MGRVAWQKETSRKRIFLSGKANKMKFNSITERHSITKARFVSKSLKNLINSTKCIQSNSKTGKGKCYVNTSAKEHKDVLDAKNELKKRKQLSFEKNVNLIELCLCKPSVCDDLEKKDLEKEEYKKLSLKFCKEDILRKLLPEADENDGMEKLNSIFQLNLTTKHEKLQSLFTDGDKRIGSEDLVICMYFTKDTSCNCKVASQSGQSHSLTESRCSEAGGFSRTASTMTTSRNVKDRRDLYKESHGKENSSSSESFTSRSFSKLHIISKAVVCFPFNRPSDRSWCCVRNRKRKNRLRSRLPKPRPSHSPCASTSGVIPLGKSESMIYRGNPPLIRHDPPRYRDDPPPYRSLPSTSKRLPSSFTGYVPLHGRTFEGRQCGTNTGESKGNGGTSPGCADSGECQSGSIPSGGVGGVGGRGGASGGGGGGHRGGGGGDERWWPPDCPDVADLDEKDGEPEKNLGDVDKDLCSRNQQLNLNISEDTSLDGTTSGGSTRIVASGGRVMSGELSDEDNNSAMLLRQGSPRSFLLRQSLVSTDGPAWHQLEKKGPHAVHSRVLPAMVETALALFDPSQNFPSQVIQEMKPLRHSMFTEINKCLRHCFDREYLSTAFKCGMCLSLSAMIRHVGRCGNPRSKCKACDHVSNILKMHVRRCMLLEKQGTDTIPPCSDSGNFTTGFISSLLTSVPLTCPVDFCVKLRKKLQSSRSGMHQAHLEMVWGKEDLWQRMKKMVAYLYDIEVDYEIEDPEQDLLESLSLSLPMPSVAPSKMLKQTLIANFKTGLKKAKKEPPVPPAVKPKKVPPKIPPKPKFIPRMLESKEKLVVPEVERRVKTSPRRRLLGAVRDSDITDDLYGPGAAQMGDQGLAESGAAGAIATAAEPSAPPLPLYQPCDDFVQPKMVLAAGIDVSDLQVPGEGQVEYGTVEDLHLFVNRINHTRARYESGMTVKNVHEGIILEHMQHCLSVIEGRYAEGEGLEWVSIVHLGSGVTGRCWLIMDGQTHFQACVKRVDLLKFDKREVEVWSSLYHRQVADLYGVIIHENEVLMFAEFIDGGTLAEVIAKYAEDRVLYGDTDDVVRGIDIPNSLYLYQQMLSVLHYFMQPDVQVLHEDIKADNVMIRADTSELVLVDFGLARHLPPNGKVPGGESPSGAQTHWSPEKAASEGHGFPADWWAATCVLLECITTKPPWLSRYSHLKMLHFVIKMHSPPMEDVPVHLDAAVRDLIQTAWTIDPDVRPTPVKQAQHPVFCKYDVPDMVGDNPDSIVPLVEPKSVSFSVSTTTMLSEEPGMISEPSQGVEMRNKVPDGEVSANEKSANVSPGMSPEKTSSQESSEHSSDTQTPRLSMLLKPLNDNSLGNYTNTGARPKIYDPHVAPTVPSAPLATHSKSVEEEKKQLIDELLLNTMNHGEDPEEILEQLSSSSKGEDEIASNCSDEPSMILEPFISTHPEGTLIEFRKTELDILCKVRVRNLKQKWRDIIKTASRKIHTCFNDFTVIEDLHQKVPLRPELAIGQGPNTRIVYVIDNLENWPWKCAKGEIIYHESMAPYGEPFFPFCN